MGIFVLQDKDFILFALDTKIGSQGIFFFHFTFQP